jgi:hypothetical protein
MAIVNVSFSGATTLEARAAQSELTYVNQVRSAHGASEFSDVAEMCESILLNEKLPVWLANEDERSQVNQYALARWKVSSDVQRAAALAELEPVPTGI